MKMFWNKLNKLQKWSFILFASCLITMILGLILIGTVEEGFLTLKWYGVGGMQPNDLNNLNDMYKQSGGLSEAIKTYIAKASQGKFWFKISKQEQLPIQILQIDDEVQIVGNT